MKKVLIVEDEKTLRDALASKFSSEGFEVLTGENGEEGLALALDEIPDVILLDITMPVMDGITMLKKLREDEKGRDIKVLMLTNLSDGDKVSESIDQGSVGYLVKSDWSLADIVKKVTDLVDSL